MIEFSLSYQKPDNKSFDLKINPGEILFLLGANGTGKSTLMHNFFRQNRDKCTRITAHRQVWFKHNNLNITPEGREITGNNISQYDIQDDSRWKDDYGAAKAEAVIFDLIYSEHVENKIIADAARSGESSIVKQLALKQTPISTMNYILNISNLNFEIELKKGSKLVAKKPECEPYSVAELSDGERNALLIIANIFTVPENFLILLDEPERHLHRSIISPLISTLLTYRKDCAFVVSTHDIFLPLDQNSCSCLLMREYSHNPKYWIADYINSVQDMDEKMATAVLGSRRVILFTEGSLSSLDLQIYQILFPDISIKPVGNCREVERIVKGLKLSESLHGISALGIIDKDNRSDEECKKLEEDNIIALNQYSIESLYYHPTVIKGILARVHELKGLDIDKTFAQLSDDIVKHFDENKDQMAARIVEKRVKDSLQKQSPGWEKILSGNSKICFSPNDQLESEKLYIQKLIDDKDIAALISRYPFRYSPIIDCIVKKTTFVSKQEYQQAVIKMLCDCQEEKTNVINLLGDPLSDKIAALKRW